MNNKILDKNIESWIKDFPLIEKMMSLKETIWINDKKKKYNEIDKNTSINISDINDAESRLKRFASYIKVAFSDVPDGIIESDLIEINKMKEYLNKEHNTNILGKVMLKCDNNLPISGSIKSRGGIYEVLKYAEKIAIDNKMLSYNDDYSILVEDRFKKVFSKYSISVGSTGNLGLSIGIISAKLGFKVYVHMSSDAKKWKKNMLREKGVNVIEYKEDYSFAITQARKEALENKMCHFIDDENSIDLFLGYGVAALRIKKQLIDMKINVNNSNHLFVYLPCGVGGAPAGIGYALKLIYKDHIHFFFAEPTHSPAMLLGLYTGYHNSICVQDFGIDNITLADGLAVGRPSIFAGKIIENIISGCFSVTDEKMYKFLSKLIDTESINLEPSALAGMAALSNFHLSDDFKKYISYNKIDTKKVTHIIWGTGGSMVPSEIMKEYYEKGCLL